MSRGGSDTAANVNANSDAPGKFASRFQPPNQAKNWRARKDKASDLLSDLLFLLKSTGNRSSIFWGGAGVGLNVDRFCASLS